MLSATRCTALLLAAGLLIGLLHPQPARGQSTDEVPTVTRTFALVNARVVQAPGQILDRATVLVRDGLILDVGTDLDVPFDAERIDADSLTIYSGFIDGLSHAGVPTPDVDDDRPDVERPGDPPNDVAGIQPQRTATDLLDASEKDIEQLREAGFTVAHVVPRGGMLPGQGAVVLLAGDDPQAMVLRGDVSLFAQFDGASGVYPATDMAVIATFRQLFREAARQQRAGALYAENPAGMERPPFDPVHQALFAPLDGTQPVFFHTESALDIYRALRLRDELDLPMVLTGLMQGFVTTDALAEADLPLFLTLDLPEEKDRKEDTPADSTAASDTTRAAETDPGSFFVSDFRTRSYKDIDDETKNLEARQALEREKYYATAAMLAAAGLPFGFSTRDVKVKDIHANLRTMVENGLSEEDALAALTTHAADALGLSATLGTVEPGKIANLVITDGPLFDEDTKIRHVFVDGRKFTYDDKEEPSAPPALNPVGTWSYEVETPQGTVAGVITLTGEPDDLEGTITNQAMPGGAAPLDDVVLDGTTLSFVFDAGQFGRISATVEVDGDDLEGNLDVPGLGAAPLTGTRTSGPDATLR